jgi:hypothetical protein
MMAGKLQKAVLTKELIGGMPDLVHMAQAIRKKRIEEYGDDNTTDDSAERAKNGIARKAGKTKKALFGDKQGIFGEHSDD